MTHLYHILQPNFYQLKSWYLKKKKKFDIFISISLLVLTSGRNECYFLASQENWCWKLLQTTPKSQHLNTNESLMSAIIRPPFHQLCVVLRCILSHQIQWWCFWSRGPAVKEWLRNPVCFHTVSPLCDFQINPEPCRHERWGKPGKPTRLRNIL